MVSSPASTSPTGQLTENAVVHPPQSREEVTGELLSLLDVKRLDEAVFEGHSIPHPGGHVFGGQVMAQSLVAMGRTVPEGRRVHSSFGYFLEAASATEPLCFEVENLRDGGSFSARRTRVKQGSKTVLAMTASYQEVQKGLEHHDVAPEVPDPDSLPTTADVLGKVDHPLAQFFAHRRPIDIRHVSPQLYFAPDESGAREQMVWMRTLTPYDAADPHIHDAILAYATDYTPFEPIIRRQGLTWLTPGLRVATLNHAMWWHAEVDMNEWVLYVQSSPGASGGRGLATGAIYSREGRLLATVNQEGMIRVKNGEQ